MKKFLLLIFIFINYIFYSQSEAGKIQQIIPPSPNAFSFATYGNIPTNLYTGTPNISIPLYTYKIKNISVPISFGYSSSGVKIDNIGTTLGQSWVFNTGGIITKTIFGADDDKTNLNMPENSSTNYGQGFSVSFYEALKNGNFNMEYDEFNFNFLGVSGKFIIDKNKNIVLLSPSDIKISRPNLDTFMILDDKGVKYFFTAVEKTRYFVSNCEFNSSTQSISELNRTAWHLTKIVDLNSDEIEFEYYDATYNYDALHTQMLKSPIATLGWSNGFIPNNNTAKINCTSMQTNYVKLLKSIYNNRNSSKINFTYVENDFINGNKLLDKIEVFNGINNIEKIELNYLKTAFRYFLTNIGFTKSKQKYAFEYDEPEGLPQLNSYSQDYWGFYNGQENGDYFVPKLPEFNNIGANRNPNFNYAKKGILKKITYPTGGNTQLFYEPNSVWALEDLQIQAGETITKNINYTSAGSYADDPKYYANSFLFTTENMGTDGLLIDISASTSFYNQSICPRFYRPGDPVNGDLSMIISLFEVSTGNKISLCPTFETNPNLCPTQDAILWVNSQNSIQTHPRLKSNTTYRVEVSAPDCLKTSINIQLYKYPLVRNYTNKEVGGLRIRKTVETTFGASPIVKSYYYNKITNRLQSSGVIEQQPSYISTTETRVYDGFDLNDPYRYLTCLNYNAQKYVIGASTSSVNIFNSHGGNNISYRYVTESLGGENFENGGIQHQFIINKDATANPIFGEEYFNISRYTNSGWNDSNEVETNYYDSNIKHKIKIVRTFQEEKKNSTKYDNFIITESFNRPENCVTSVTMGMENKNISYYYKQLVRSILTKEEKTEYTSNDSIKTNTEYFYENPNHFQLTRQKVTMPDNSFLETKYWYAEELSNVRLKNANIVGIPLQTTVTKTFNNLPKTISNTEIKYNDTTHLLPTSVVNYDLQTSAPSTEITYDKYDSTNGNLQQYTLKSGIPVAIIWGYNNTQPIAKIEGATYDAISGLISSIINESNNDDLQGTPDTENALITALDLFRTNSAFSNYQITTYTYDPLIGVTSITPPSGIREIYKYDLGNRLQSVVDINGNILKEYSYQYKQ